MIHEIESELLEHRDLLQRLLRRYAGLGRALLLRSDLVETLDEFCDADEGAGLAGRRIHEWLRSAQEAIVQPPLVSFALRQRIGSWRWVQCHVDHVTMRELTASEFLQCKERWIQDGAAPDPHLLEVDLGPFERGFPRMKEARSIGRGVEFMNRFLAGRLFASDGKGPELLFEFLRLHQIQGRPLMLNGSLAGPDELVGALRQAESMLEEHDDPTPWSEVEPALRRLGFEPGWGKDVARVRESMALLLDVLEAASPDTVARFLSRVPMIFSVAILSPHGFFGQSDVLGKPDTGGQVVYILDQVRALEREMLRAAREQGLDVKPRIRVITRLIPESRGTTCHEPREAVFGTKHAYIMRVPFRDERGEVLPHWISRFRVWPYLEDFAAEVERELLADLGGRPDLIVGNYSDGNLVATLLATSLGVTQCTIAHALEKAKYLHSDLYWKDHEAEHHFSCQFTADLIAMNRADFIISSTFQEIAGTRSSIGQYESYRSWSMPGLYRVVDGIDAFDPKFNIVAPGADPEVFFPPDRRKRDATLRDDVRAAIRGGPDGQSVGRLADPDKPLLFAMSRLDRIKNMAGFLEWYARDERLRERANVLLVGGTHDPGRSDDADERAQIERMHALLDGNDLHGQVRWLEMHTDKQRVGELYRCVADSRGAFVQPALFEAFGLTVVEAMSTGLPVFATCYGGPLEIIEDGKSGFHIDPNHGDAATARMADFLGACADDPARWEAIRKGALDRVKARYTWKLYAGRLLSLSRIYGFWKYVTDIHREETDRYLDMFYTLMYRRLARTVGE